MIIDTESLGIKPCPFCGEYPILYQDKAGYSIGCPNAGCACNPDTFYFETTEEVIKVWNKRVKETN